MKINPVLAIDSYKLAHITMYPENIIGTYLNLTPRSIRHFKKLIPAQFKYDNKIVAVGMQMAIQDIVDTFTDEFFSKPLEQTLEIYTDGTNTNLIDFFKNKIVTIGEDNEV